MLRGPTDVYIDNNSTIYILDAGNYRVQCIFFNSTIGTTIINSSNGTEPNQFASSKFNIVWIKSNVYAVFC
jgi:hypothetical protein